MFPAHPIRRPPLEAFPSHLRVFLPCYDDYGAVQIQARESTDSSQSRGFVPTSKDDSDATALHDTGWLGIRNQLDAHIENPLFRILALRSASLGSEQLWGRWFGSERNVTNESGEKIYCCNLAFVKKCIT